MTDLHDWLRNAYAAQQASLDPLIQQFNQGLGMKVGLNAVMAGIASEVPFQRLMDQLVEQVIRPEAGKLRFSTAGHLGHLDGKTLAQAQSMDCPCAATVALSRIRQHLEVSIAYLLRDIRFGKRTLFGLDWHLYSFSLPRIPSEKTDRPIKLMADLKTSIIYCPEHPFAASRAAPDNRGKRNPTEFPARLN